MSLEARLSALESTLSKDILRIDALEQTEQCQMKDEWSNVLRSVDPGSALSYQTSAAIIYRRQEVLARESFLKEGMNQLSEILSLLKIEKSQPLTEQQVSSAPLLDVTVPDAAPLQALEDKVNEFQQGTLDVSQRLDKLLQDYQRLVTRASETIVLHHEKQNQPEER